MPVVPTIALGLSAFRQAYGQIIHGQEKIALYLEGYHAAAA